MALRKTEPSQEDEAPSADVGSVAWQHARSSSLLLFTDNARRDRSPQSPLARKPSQNDALQTLLSLAALHEQLIKRKALTRQAHSDSRLLAAHLEEVPQFALDETLQLIADRAAAITGANGSAIAIAENNEIVLRAAAGAVRPEMGARIDCNSLFSGACLRMAQFVSCDDTETDERVNLEACRSLGVRSIVAVPLFGRRGVIGLLETFSALPFGFSDGDICNLNSLAELVHGALKPEDDDRCAESARVALAQLESIEDRRKICVAETGVHDEPPLESKAHAPERFVTAQSARIHSEESKISTRRSDILVLLASIAIVAVLAEVAWWKPRTAGLSKGAVKTKDVRTQTLTSKQTTSPSLSSSLGAAATNRSAASTVGSPPNSPTSRKALSTFPRVTGIQHWSSGESSTVVFDLDDPVQYEVHRVAGPERIYFDLHNTQLVPALAGRSIRVGDALLKRIRVAQPAAGTTRIVLETKVLSDVSVTIEQNPYRLVVEVQKIDFP